jgi:hypothetical protein
MPDRRERKRSRSVTTPRLGSSNGCVPEAGRGSRCVIGQWKVISICETAGKSNVAVAVIGEPLGVAPYWISHEPFGPGWQGQIPTSVQSTSENACELAT